METPAMSRGFYFRLTEDSSCAAASPREKGRKANQQLDCASRATAAATPAAATRSRRRGEGARNSADR